MKLQSLILCFTLLVFNCSKSDDSIDEKGQLPPPSFSLILDEGTENEMIFNNYADLARAEIPCGNYVVKVDDLVSENFIITDFSVGFTPNIMESLGTMQSGEYWSSGEESLKCSAYFNINGLIFLDTSGLFTITSYTGSFDDDNLIGSGYANLVMSSISSSDDSSHTIRMEFENIKVTYVGAC